MEYDRTYALGFGKSFGRQVVRVQYIYQRVQELPMKNQGVKVCNIRLIFNYKL